MKSFDNLNNWREEFLIQVLLYLFSILQKSISIKICDFILKLIHDDDLRKNLQASPSDPENFPFVVLGNKVDVDGGNSRVVCILNASHNTPPFTYSFLCR